MQYICYESKNIENFEATTGTWELKQDRIAGSVNIPDGANTEISFDITIPGTSPGEREIFCVAKTTSRETVFYIALEANKTSLVIWSNMIPGVDMFVVKTEELPTGKPIRFTYSIKYNAPNYTHICSANGIEKTYTTSKQTVIGDNMGIYMAGKISPVSNVIIQNLNYKVNGNPITVSAGAGAVAGAGAPVAAGPITPAPITAAIAAAAVAAAQSASVLAGVAATAPVDSVPEASSEIISGIPNMTLYITAGVAVVILLVFLMK